MSLQPGLGCFNPDISVPEQAALTEGDSEAEWVGLLRAWRAWPTAPSTSSLGSPCQEARPTDAEQRNPLSPSSLLRGTAFCSTCAASR